MCYTVTVRAPRDVILRGMQALFEAEEVRNVNCQPGD